MYNEAGWCGAVASRHRHVNVWGCTVMAQVDWLIDVALNTKQVISETFFPANLLA